MADLETRRNASSRPSAVFEPAVEGARGPASLGLLALVRTAAWFGLVAGGLELTALAVQDAYDLRVTVADIRTNRHHLWMAPFADLLLIGGLAAPLGLLGRIWPRTRRARLAVGLLAWPALLAPLLAIRGLHPAAALVLALGLAVRAAGAIERRWAGFDRLVKLSLPALLIGLAALGVVHHRRVTGSEAAALAALPPARPGSPNVLLIVLDNVRADRLSLHGYHRDTTPSLRRWAGRGARFDRARATAPWTLPSHASMLTGRWPHELSTTVDRPLDAARPTLAEFLASQGYAAAGLVANTYYCNALYGLGRGFARYEDFYENEQINLYEVLYASRLGARLTLALGLEPGTPGGQPSRKSAAEINRDALGWVDARVAENRPFFAFLNYYDAHGPFIPPDDYARQFGLSRLPRAEQAAIMGRYARLVRGKAREEGGPSDAEVNRAALELMSDTYDDCIAYLDGQVGRLLDDLDRRGVLDSTLVIVTSDHGEHLGDHGLIGHGQSLYQPLVHVPLLVIPPSGTASGLERGGSVAGPVSLRQIPATVADLTGLADRSPFPGRSLARPERAPGSETERPLSEVEHQRKFDPGPLIPASRGPLWSLTDGDRKYIRHDDGTEQLFDLAADPGEARNLADAPGVLPELERFRAELERRLGER